MYELLFMQGLELNYALEPNQGFITANTHFKIEMRKTFYCLYGASYLLNGYRERYKSLCRQSEYEPNNKKLRITLQS